MRCPNPSCPHLVKYKQPAELRAGVTTCPDCGAALVEALAAPSSSMAFPSTLRSPLSSRSGVRGVPALPGVQGVPALPALTPPVLRRLAWVAAALVVVEIGARVPLPFVDVEVAEVIARMQGGSTLGRLGAFSVLAIGIAPFLAASLLVELVAALFFRAQRERAAGRARIERAVDVVGTVLACAQAFFLLRSAQSMSNGSYGSYGAYGSYGFAGGSYGFAGDVVDITFAPAYLLALVAGAVLSRLFARVLDTRGLGGGMALLSVVGTVAAIVDSAVVARQLWVQGALTPLALVSMLVVFGAALAIAVVIVQPPQGPLELPRPAAGLVPLVGAGAVVTAIGWGLELDGDVRVLQGIVVVIGAVAITLVLGRPAALLGAARRFDASTSSGAGALRGAVRQAMPWAIGAPLGLFVLASVTHLAAPLPFAAVPLLAAALRDVVTEARFRGEHGDALEVVAVLPSLRQLGPAQHVLEAAGVPVHVRAATLRTLLSFLGPYARLDVLVPAADAEHARALLALR